MTDQATSVTETVDREVRLHVFHQAAETARVPKSEEIAAALDLSPPEVEESLYRLAASHLLVLAPGTANVWVAPPFCAVPTDFRVHAEGRTYWGICIWDALGIPAALHADATITARCGDCGDEIGLEVQEGRLVRGEGIVHFAVPAIRWWENIAFA
jgi:Alkylmercury lyase